MGGGACTVGHTDASGSYNHAGWSWAYAYRSYTDEADYVDGIDGVGVVFDAWGIFLRRIPTLGNLVQNRGALVGLIP